MIMLMVVLGLLFAYHYPLQKQLALSQFHHYIHKQGVEVSNITEQEIIKDWKQGGYLFVVSYEDDPDHRYYYHYNLWTNRRGEGLQVDRMTLDVVDIKKGIQLDPPYDGKCTYPPLKG